MTLLTPETSSGEGIHNSDLEVSVGRLTKGQTYKDLSTVIIIPTRGMVHIRVVQSWMNLIKPMNQRVFHLPIWGEEVGEAYNRAVCTVLDHPDLSKFKYILSIEEDNIPPPDGLMKLYESIEGGVDGVQYDVVGGLYWTKGEMGQPMIYGDPRVLPLNFIPQLPLADTIQPCNGMGMGFHLFRVSLFSDSRLTRPYFKTCQEVVPGVGTKLYTQDLYFYERVGGLGYKFACDTRVKVGHHDAIGDIVW